MIRKKKKQKDKEKRMSYFFLFLGIFVVGFLLIMNVNLWKQRQITREQYSKIEQKLGEVSLQKELLEGEKSESDVESELERVAREQLLLKKDGESVIVISREEAEVGISVVEEETEDEKKMGFWESLKEAFNNNQ